MTGKTFQYAVELDGGGRLTIPGGGQFVPPEGWSADHLLLAALVRCSVDSFAYHARRAGHEVAATGSAHGTIMKTGADGRYRFVTIGVRLDVQLTPRATDPSDLIMKAERDCFVGASLTADAGVRVARVLTTVDAVRARFTALQRDLAFFDAPGGTQVPDSVIDAIGDYLREANANLGGPFETSRRSDALIARAHTTAAGFLNATVDEVAFGANMTTLNFALSRAASRDWREGDEIVCTQLDHDGNISPWLELAHDRGFKVQLARVDDECRLDLDHLRSLVNERTRVVAYPVGGERRRHGHARRRDRRRSRTTRARSRGSTPSTTARTGRSTSRRPARTCCSARRTSSTGRTLGSRSGAVSCWSRGGRTRCARPTCSRSGTATRRGRSPTSCSPASSRPWTTSTTSAGTSSSSTRTSSGQQFLDGLPDGWTLHGIPSMDGRVPTFALTHASLSPQEAATRLGERGFAVWHGNYYAVEIMKRLGLPDGAVRIGIVHYNTAHEVDRLLLELAKL